MSSLLAEKMMSSLRPGMRVLDLGAGSGKHAIMFHDAGCLVTAVDKAAPTILPDGIDWRTESIESFIGCFKNEIKFDFVFIQNLLHFLPKEWVLKKLLPWVDLHTSINGFVAIRTFTASPQPPYKQELSYYTNKELLDAFPYSHWMKIVAQLSEVTVPSHKFFIVDRMVKKIKKTGGYN